MQRIVILILVIFSLNSCVTRYSNIYQDHNILIDFKSNNSDIDISDFTIIRGKVTYTNKYYRLEFQSLPGGGGEKK